MIRNYVYKLYASKHTKDLSRLVTSTNFAWNHVVELARRYYKLYHVSLPLGKLLKHMAKLRKKDPFWCKLYAQSMQAICQKYADALNAHFKNGRGFPREHKKHAGGSVLFKSASDFKLTVDSKTGILVINKLGKNWKFKFKVTRPWGDIKNITVKRDNDGSLYLVVCCNVPEQHLEREDSGSIGMDFGLKTFLTLSDGSSVEIPDYHKQALDETKAADRSYSLKRNARVYGTSFKRAKKRKQKLHRKVADRRSDFHWKLAHELCKRYKFIAIEDLNIEGMKRYGHWGRKVSSLGYGEFIQKLLVVAEKYGTIVQKIDRWAPSSQVCSECGYQWKGTKDLNVREWTCPECGCVNDRDVNAARNILRLGIERYTGEGVPLAGSGSQSLQGSPGQCSHVGALVAPGLAKNPMTFSRGSTSRFKEKRSLIMEDRSKLAKLREWVEESYCHQSNVAIEFPHSTAATKAETMHLVLDWIDELTADGNQLYEGTDNTDACNAAAMDKFATLHVLAFRKSIDLYKRGFRDGADWMADKATDWLNENVDNYNDYDGLDECAFNFDFQHALTALTTETE